MLVKAQSLRQQEHAVPRALMVGRCGGNEQVFLQGLADGDITEVLKNGQKLYSWKEYSKARC